jgi:hypothetical protein
LACGTPVRFTRSSQEKNSQAQNGSKAKLHGFAFGSQARHAQGVAHELVVNHNVGSHGV